LRGTDGRVRVVDFGLAAVSEDPDHDEADAERPALPEHAGEARLTSTGAILGTPLYMAPEQHEGGRASPASDQYSLCTALYEGLYGALPFATGPGADLAEVLARKRSGALGPPPAGAPVPAWIHAALARGLATRPEDRHPSIP